MTPSPHLTQMQQTQSQHVPQTLFGNYSPPSDTFDEAFTSSREP